MAAPDVTLSIGGNFRPALEGTNSFARQAQRIVNKNRLSVDIDTRKSEMALGRITGRADEFTKSLEASNARVIAFGASAAVIEGSRRAFKNLVSSIVETEKSLNRLNTILGASESRLSGISDQLFKIAKTTNSTFQSVTEAAESLARQGLSTEETLKRLSDAMVLSRITGLDAKSSIESLTAVLSGFNREALDTTQIINKLAAVEGSFGVTSSTLVDSLNRSAVSAQEAGVSFDQLLGLITSIQRRTGSGGATVGRGIESIFSRLASQNVIDSLRNVGVEIDDAQDGIQKLRAIAEAVQRSAPFEARNIKEIAAGSAQVNVLTAALEDLIGGYSSLDAVIRRSAAATNEATLLNDKYNTSISAMGNSIAQTFTQIANSIGELGGEAAIKDILRNFHEVLSIISGESVSSNQGWVRMLDDFMKRFREVGILGVSAKEAVEGIVNVLSGPGLILGAAVFVNIFAKTTKFAFQALNTLVQISSTKEKEAQTQTAINALLQKATQEELRSLSAAQSQAAQQRIILGILERQLAVQDQITTRSLLTAQNMVRQGISIAYDGGAFSRANSLKGRTMGKLAPRYAGGILPAIQREAEDISRGVGGASRSAVPRVIQNFAFGSGKRGPAVVNTDEYIVPNYAGSGADAVFNQDMIRTMGLPKGARSLAGGFVPNLARGLGVRRRNLEAISARLEAGALLTAKQAADLEQAAANHPQGLAGLQGEGYLSSLAARRIRELGGVFSASRAPFATSRGMPAPSPPVSSRFLQAKARVAKAGFVKPPPPLQGPPAPTATQRAISRNMASRAESSRVTGGVKTEAPPYVDIYAGSGGSKKPRLKKGPSRVSMDPKESAGVRRAITAIGRRDIQRDLDSYLSQGASSIPEEDLKDFYREFVRKETESLQISPETWSKIEKNIKQGTSTRRERNLSRRINRAAQQSVDDLVEANRAIVAQARERTAQEQLINAQARLNRRTSGFRGFFRSPMAQAEHVGQNLPTAQRGQLMEIARARQTQRRQRMGHIGLAAAFAGSFLAPAIGESVSGVAGERAGRGVTGALSGAASGALLGSVVGPWGTAVGAVVGGIVGLTKELTSAGSSIDTARDKFAKLSDTFQKDQQAIASYQQAQSQLNMLFESGSFSGQQVERVLRASSDAINSISNEEDRRAMLLATTDEERAEVQERIERRRQREKVLAGSAASIENLQKETERGWFTRTRRRVGRLYGRDSQTISRDASSSLDLSSEQGDTLRGAIFSSADMSEIMKNPQKAIEDMEDSFQQMRKAMGVMFSPESRDRGFILQEDIEAAREQIGRSLKSQGIEMDLSKSTPEFLGSIVEAYGQSIDEVEKRVEEIAMARAEVSVRLSRSLLGRRIGRESRLNIQDGRLSDLQEFSKREQSLSLQRSQFEAAAQEGRASFGDLYRLRTQEADLQIDKQLADLKRTISHNLIGVIAPAIEKLSGAGAAEAKEIVDTISKGDFNSFQELRDISMRMLDIPAVGNEIHEQLKSILDNAAASYDEQKIHTELLKQARDQALSRELISNFRAMMRGMGVELSPATMKERAAVAFTADADVNRPESLEDFRKVEENLLRDPLNLLSDLFRGVASTGDHGARRAQELRGAFLEARARESNLHTSPIDSNIRALESLMGSDLVTEGGNLHTLLEDIMSQLKLSQSSLSEMLQDRPDLQRAQERLERARERAAPSEEKEIQSAYERSMADLRGRILDIEGGIKRARSITPSSVEESEEIHKDIEAMLQQRNSYRAALKEVEAVRDRRLADLEKRREEERAAEELSKQRSTQRHTTGQRVEAAVDSHAAAQRVETEMSSLSELQQIQKDIKEGAINQREGIEKMAEISERFRESMEKGFNVSTEISNSIVIEGIDDIRQSFETYQEAFDEISRKYDQAISEIKKLEAALRGTPPPPGNA